MTATQNKSIVVVCRKAPYGETLAREAIDVALAISVFEQKLAIVFTGDGVWQLLKEQNSTEIQTKNQAKQLSALSLYDINDVYIDSEALQKRQLSENDLIIEGKLLPPTSLATVINEFDVILSF